MLGERIRKTRLEFGWSQVELARKLNITKQTVSNWENDNIQPSVDMLIRLTQLFNVSSDYILGIDDIPRISVEGIPEEAAAHLSLLISDIRND